MGVYIYKKGLKKIAATMGGILVCALVLNITLFNEEFALPVQGEPEKKVPVYCVDTPEKKIAISFDAAWGDEHTEPILNILDEYGVKTTFFLVKFWAEKFQDDVKEIHARGHEIGNHSSTHPNMTKLSSEEMQKELLGLEEAVMSVTGKKPTVFRPPFGAYNNTLIEVCGENGYQVIQWSVDSMDWKKLSGDQIVERVCRNVKPGSIVLFHNNADKVEEYLPAILSKLKEEGYSVVPVSELIYQDNYKIDHTGKQILDKSGGDNQLI